MKNTKKCPKCLSQSIIRIGGSEKTSSGNNFPIRLTAFKAVQVTRYLCGNCDFSEEWIDNKEDISKIKEHFL